MFAEAHSVGLGDELELQALARAADHLDAVTGYVAMNVSPQTLLTPACAALLVGTLTACSASGEDDGKTSVVASFYPAEFLAERDSNEVFEYLIHVEQNRRADRLSVPNLGGGES